MEDLRITTPRKQTRLVVTKKKHKARSAGFFSRVANIFRPKSIKAEARLDAGDKDGQGADDGKGNDDDDDLDEEAAARKRMENDASTRPTVPGSKGKEVWDGTGEPPFTEGSVTWSEDRSRAASDVGDNVVDMMMSNPSRIVKEPPVFFDPVEDQVRSRWLAVLAMCAFPTILATILLVDVWDNSALFTRDARPKLSLLYRSGDPFILGRVGEANLSLKVLVTNFYDWPLRDQAITATISARELSPAVLRRLPFCQAAQGGTAHAKASRQVCEYSIRGEQAVADRDGVAVFTEIAIMTGLPGAYHLTIAAPGARVNVSLWVQVRSQVSAIVAAGDSAALEDRSSVSSLTFASSTIPLTLTSPAPAARVIVARTGDVATSVEGLPVYAIAIRKNRDLDGELSQHTLLSSVASQPVIPDPVVVLDGNVATTDQDGLATFSSLSVLGFDNPNLLLALVCQGEVLVWSEVSPRSAVQRGQVYQGHGAMPTVAMTALAAPSSVVEAALQGGMSVQGTPRTLREGESAGVDITLPEALKGVALVGRAVPLESAIAMAESEAEGVPSAAQAGESVAGSSRFKQLVNGAVIFTSSDSFGVAFAFSHFGAVGDYNIELVAMGVVAATVGPINVTSSVGVAMVTMAGGSQVVCGRERYPVCRHLAGACSFGALAGEEVKEVADSAGCVGMEVLVQYGGRDQLPWVQLVGLDSRTPVQNKQVRLLAVPWTDTAQSVDNLTQSESGLLSTSQPVHASSTFGAVSFSAMKVLMSSQQTTYVQLAVGFDGVLQVLPIRIQLHNRVAQAERRCGGARACSFIRVMQRIPNNVTAGEDVHPSPSAMVVDGEGSPLAGRVVCLAYGSANEVEDETGGIEGASAVSQLSYNNVTAEGVFAKTGAATLACAVSGPDGMAAMSSVRLRSLPDGRTGVWRFYAPNLMESSQAGCLAFSGVWAAGCRSSLQIVHVTNPVAWIAAVGGSGAAVTSFLGHQAVEVQANNTEGAELTEVRLEVSCQTSEGVASACRDVEAQVSQWWNSNAGLGLAGQGCGSGNAQEAFNVGVVSQRFSASAGSGGNGVLELVLNTGLAGNYLVELNSWGVSSSVFVVARHLTAATLVQLSDLNAARDGNYSACTLDCGARNVSNLGRHHPQHIRVLVQDAVGDAVFQAQVHAMLVDVDGVPQPGQVAGAVSQPLRTNSTTGMQYADFPCLALTAVAPGTYRFRLSLHGPGRAESAPEPILTEVFYVHDRVEVSVSQHPPAVLGAAVRARESAVEADVMSRVSATVRIRRWEGHTAFMYNASCPAPLVQVDLGVVKVSEIASQKLVQGEWWGVENGAAGKTVLRSDPAIGPDGRQNEVVWDCWGVSSVATARFDSVLAVAAPGYYCLAVSGVALEPDMDSGLTESYTGAPPAIERVCSRPFALGVRPVGVYLLSEWERQYVGVGETFTADLRLVGPVGAVLEGHVIEALVAEDCGLPDGSCAPKGGQLKVGTGVAVTDPSGRARLEIIMGAGRPGWYRFKFRCSGVQSLVSEPVYVRGRVAGIQIVEAMIGVSELEKVPARPLGSYEFGGVQDYVTVPGVHTVTGDLSAYLSLQLPKVRVVDEHGSALFFDTEVELHLVTCGQKHMANGTVVFPPTGECVEFIEFESLRPIFTCSSVSGCDVGTTRFTQIQFSTTTNTGFYYVFFVVQGVVQLQEDPIYIRNSLIPADTTITTFRLCILVAVFGMVLLFNANLVYRARFWCQISLLGCGIFFLITILYGNALLNKYGDPSKVPSELVASATLMVLNALGLTVILTRLVLQSDSKQYFTSRQEKYLLALRGLLVARHAEGESRSGSSHGRRTPLRGRQKVHPAPEQQDKPGSAASSGQHAPGSRQGLRFRGSSAGSERSVASLGVGKKLSKVAEFFSNSAAAATGRTAAQDVLSGFSYPSRLYQGFGMSTVGVLILLVFCQSMINSLVYTVERLRAEVVAYRGSLGMWKTSTDQSTDLAAVPIPPYSDRIDLAALTFSLVEAIYPDGPELFEGLIFRVYRKKMLEIRADRSLIDHFKFPIHEASGYIGRQLWACVVSALLVYLPVMFGVQLCIWAPTQRFFLVYLALPIAGLTIIEALSYGARQVINRAAVRGIYIQNRRLFGWYDFIGLYLHFISGSSLAILRMLLTYIDFAVNFARLDLPIFEGSLQNLDPGHSSFMAMLYLDYVYNSPITSVLATNLANAMKIRRMKNEMMEDEVRPEQQAMLKQARNERAQRNKWQLLFTITRNESMKQYRVQPPPPRNAWDSDDEGSVSSGASERRAREELEQRAALQKKGLAPR